MLHSIYQATNKNEILKFIRNNEPVSAFALLEVFKVEAEDFLDITNDLLKDDLIIEDLDGIDYEGVPMIFYSSKKRDQK